MKNKIYKFLLILFCICYVNKSNADELDISATEVRVDRDNQIVYGEGNVEISDVEKNLIKSEKAEYNKAKNLLKAIGKTYIETSEKFEISGTDIFYDRQKKLFILKMIR